MHLNSEYTTEKQLKCVDDVGDDSDGNDDHDSEWLQWLCSVASLYVIVLKIPTKSRYLAGRDNYIKQFFIIYCIYEWSDHNEHHFPDTLLVSIEESQ